MGHNIIVGARNLKSKIANKMTPATSHRGVQTTLLLVLVTSVIIRTVESFSTSTDCMDGVYSSSHPQHQLVFPIRPDPSGATRSEVDIGISLSSAFEALVGSSEFMIQSSSASTSGHGLSSCRMPDFGEYATVTFAPRPSTCDRYGNPTEYILFAFDFDRPTEDFGMLCLELYRHRSDIRHAVCIKDLESNVLDFLNSQPPDAGIDAEITSSEAIGETKFGLILKRIDSDALDKLQRDGFVVIDNVIKTTQSSNEKLDGKTNINQGKRKTDARDYRTDKVAFFNRENALEYGLEDQHDFLLTLASHLNGNLDIAFRGHSLYTPVFPGTAERPLTNPSGFSVQFAEYAENDHYNPHSDNSVDIKLKMCGVFDVTRPIDAKSDSDGTLLPSRRINWRYITAILYMNEGWEKGDGGQLRLYLDSSDVIHPNMVLDEHDFIDINPSNGKLLLFDSRMIHSVEKVLKEGKTRRALTLWIIRPEESGARGEDYFLIDDDGGIIEQ